MENYTQHPETEPAPRIFDADVLNPKKKPVRNIAIIALAAVVIVAVASLTTLTVLSKDATPGEPLYGFKTKFYEKAVAATKFSDTAKAEYAVSRLESRLFELQLLAADSATSSDDTLNHIAWLSQSHAEVAMSSLDTTSVSYEERINALATLTGITRAQEILVDETPEFGVITKQVSDFEGRANDALQMTINSFASSTDKGILSEYLKTQIASVSELLPSVANGSRAQTIAIRRIEDTNEAIADESFDDAIYYILKAKEAITVDQYLYNAERGYVDGITVDPGEIPEGN